MKLDFYYFSYQCPLNDGMLGLLEGYSDRLEINIHDISGDFRTAKEMDIFFPTLIVLDGRKRYYSPFGRAFLELAAAGEYPMKRPYLPEISETEAENIIAPITGENADIACGCCGNKSESGCLRKKIFLEGTGLEVYGFMHRAPDGSLLGGVEYLPSEMVPYDVPHGEDTAFITCVYMSDTRLDYKSAPLRALEKYLKSRYKKVIAVSDEKGIFPNGDLAFFIRNDYKDGGIIFEDTNYCRLHLVSKAL